MSGAEPDRKRKKRRKTRAERNQMCQHHQMHQSDKQKHKKQSKTVMEPTQSTSYTLRSSKDTSQTSLVLNDFKRATARTITQGRLTRSLGILNFSHARSSDWMKRDPIPETESVKRKVESDVKRILNLAERDALSNNGDRSKGLVVETHKKPVEVANASDTDHDAMEVDATVVRISPENKSALEMSKSKSVVDNKVLTVTVAATSATSVPTIITITPSKSAASLTSQSPSSANNDESLEPQPPVEEIAEKILQELKPKFDRMFPDRDIEMEICSDLHKLLRQSSYQTETIQTDSAQNFISSGPATLTYSTPGLPAQVSFKSTLSACRPVGHGGEGEAFHPQLSHLPATLHQEASSPPRLQEPIFYQCNADQDAVTFCRTVATSPPYTATFLMTEPQEMEPVMRLKLEVEDSDDEEDNDDILSAARYNAFMASARELEAEQRRLQELNRFSTVGQVTPSHLSSFQHFLDHQHLRRQSCGPTDDETTSCSSREQLQSSSQSSEWRSLHSVRRLNFSDLNQTYQAPHFSCPAKSVSQGLHLSHQPHHPNPHLQRYHSDSRCISSNSPHILRVFGLHNCADNRDRPLQSCPQPVLRSSARVREKKRSFKIGPDLAQSRRNLQTALDSACKLSDGNYGKATEPMDWDMNEDHLTSLDGFGSFQQPSSHQSCRYRKTWSMAELQAHQADLQQQAKDFLEDFDRNHRKQQACHSSHQSGCPTRHLYQMASPDSAGSPVWMAPVLKDLNVNASGFA